MPKFSEIYNQIELEPVTMPLYKDMTGAGEGGNGASVKVTASKNDPSFLVSAEAKNTGKNDPETIKTHTENVKASLNAHEPERAAAEADQVKLPKKIFSLKLGCEIWLATDEAQAQGLRDKGETGIYTLAETQMLKGSAPEHLRAVHTAKLIFDGARVVEKTPKTDRPTGVYLVTKDGQYHQPHKEKPLPCRRGRGATHNRHEAAK